MASRETSEKRGILRFTPVPTRRPDVVIPIPPPVKEPDIFIRPQEPKISPPPTEPTLGQKLAEVLKRIAKAKATKIIGAAVALTSPFAVQHHAQTHEELSLQGVARDVGAIPSTAEKDFNFLLQKLGLRSAAENVPVPSVFNNLADTGVIGNDNTGKLSQAEIDQQFPSAFAKLGDGKNTLQFQYLLDTTASANPTARISYKKSFSGTTFAEREQYKKLGFYDTYDFRNVPGGTIIKAPVDGYLRLSVEPPIAPNGADNQGALIDFLDSLTGNQYRITIWGYMPKDFKDQDSSNITGYVFNNLVDGAQAAAGEDNAKSIGEYGIKVKKGQPILKAIDGNGNPIEAVGFNVIIARKGNSGQPINMSKPSIPTNIDLFTSPDGKLITSTG